MNETEKTQAEENVPVPEKDLEEVAGAGWIIIDRAVEPFDPPVGAGGGG